MKLKLLTLLLTIGLFALGMSVRAEEEKAPELSDPVAIAMHKSIAVGADIPSTACSMLSAARLLSSKILPCAACSATTKTLADVVACVAKDESLGLTSYFKTACNKGCGKYFCGSSLYPYSAQTAQVCQSICCSIDGSDPEVQACMTASKAKLTCTGK